MQCGILIVEDEMIVRKALRYIIENDGEGFCIVGEVMNGEEALDFLEKSSELPHIVISDIIMPKKNGIELLQILHTRYPSIQSIVLSGYQDFNYAREAFKFGAVDYLLKPELESDILLKLLLKISTQLGLDTKEKKTRKRKSESKEELVTILPDINQEQISDLIKSHRIDLAMNYTLAYFDKVKHGIYSYTEIVKVIENNIYSMLFILREDKKIGEILEEKKFSYLSKITEASDIEKLRFVCEQIYNEVIVLGAGLEDFSIGTRVAAYLGVHFREEVTLKALARHFGVNHTYLSAVFSMQVGVGINEYLNHIRIDEAKKLLEDVNLSIADIAQRVGYSDQSYFGKVFKKRVGLSPHNYRQREYAAKEEIYMEELRE